MKCSLCKKTGHNKLNCDQNTTLQLTIERKCAICLSNITNKKGHVTTNCQHSFCFKCFMNWIHENNTCPMCRQKVKKKNKDKIIEVEIEVPVIQEVEIEVPVEVPVIQEKIVRVLNIESYLISMAMGFMICLSYYSTKIHYLEN